MTRRLLLLLCLLPAAGCGEYGGCLLDCEEVPELPWDPGEGGGADGYGSGGTGGGGDDGGDDGVIEDTAIELVSQRDCVVTARYSPGTALSSLSIAGEFNAWTPTPMEDADGDGVWTLILGELAPGSYAFKYLPNGDWEGDPPATVYTQWSGGSENRSLRVGDCTVPLLQTVSGSATAEGALQASFLVASAADGARLDPAQVVVTVGGNPVTPEIDPSTGAITVSLSGLSPGKHSVRVWASDTMGRLAEGSPAFLPLWVEAEPFDWRDGLMYFAFIDRFANSDGSSAPVGGVATTANYQGGDLQGVIDKLDEGYFDALGVRTIWLSPLYENPDGAFLGADGVHTFTGYHGYWPVEAQGIESRFGDSGASAEERLVELIDKAHARGIRVLFDLVLNHVHEDHEYTRDHPEWFTGGCVCGTSGCGWEEKPVECWFTDYLPDLSYKNHAITTTVLADTRALVTTYDVDALRIDAAKHMDHVIMRSLSMGLRDDIEAPGGAPFYLVGETFSSDRGLIMDYVAPYELDAQFDFPLYFALREAFAGGGSLRTLASAVSAGEAAYGDAPMSPFLGNHDVERMATALTGESGDPWSGWLVDPMAEGGSSVTEWDTINRLSLAFAFLLTQPGVPLLYYGDEIGLHGGGDPDNRRLMQFEPSLSANQRTLLDRVAALGQARAQSLALRRGSRTELWVDDDLFSYSRDAGGSDVAVVLINRGGSSRTVDLTVPSSWSGWSFADSLDGSPTATVSGSRLTVTVGAQDYAILEPR